MNELQDFPRINFYIIFSFGIAKSGFSLFDYIPQVRILPGEINIVYLGVLDPRAYSFPASLSGFSAKTHVVYSDRDNSLPQKAE